MGTLENILAELQQINLKLGRLLDLKNDKDCEKLAEEENWLNEFIDEVLEGQKF